MPDNLSIFNAHEDAPQRIEPRPQPTAESARLQTSTQQTAPAPVSVGGYEYYMVQLPSNYAAQQGKVQRQEIAGHVQQWANHLAAQGWEFTASTRWV